MGQLVPLDWESKVGVVGRERVLLGLKSSRLIGERHVGRLPTKFTCISEYM